MMEDQRRSYRRRIVVVPAPFQGHLTPMLQLASILHSKGFSITIAHTLFNSPDPSNYPDFVFLPISDGLSDDDYISSHNITTIVSSLNTNCASPFRELLLQMTKENGELRHRHPENTACVVIYDGVMHFAESLAEELNLPSILLRTGSATHVLAYHVLLHLQTNGYLPLQDDRSKIEYVGPELEPLRFKDFPILNSPNCKQALERALGVKPSLGVIYNTADYLEGQNLNQLRQRYQVPIFPIGPFHIISRDSSSSFLKQDYSCIPWLDKQAPRSVLYVSLGSIATWNEKELTEMAHGLANSKQHFLWVVRARTLVSVPEWAQSLPENVRKAIEERGCIVRWAPQKDVLAHEAVGGFWSHCGWNSTMESLCEGKPMICQPFFGDQGGNSRLASHVWKVGVEWSNVTGRDEIEKTVRRLMVDHEGKEMWQRAQEMKDELRQAVKEGGSSNNALTKLVDLLGSV